MADISSSCYRCGHMLEEGFSYVCDSCGRPIGACSECGWFGFLDQTPTPERCDRPDCEQIGPGWSDESAEKHVEAIRRVLRVQREMKERSGPFYELSKERSRIISTAWRAAGSPRHVSQVGTSNGIAYVVWHRDRSFDWVTEEDWNAWMAWQRERARLHQMYGWDTEYARRYGKLIDDE